MPYRPPDPTTEQVEEATSRWILAGIVLTVLFVLAFPAYRLYEPSSRAEARETALASLAEQGFDLYAANCAECHGERGEGVDAPALNSQQFLSAATDEQIASLIAHGVPGTEMAAYSLDFGGFLTSEQIEAVAVFLRSLEQDAPDRPDWRFVGAGGNGHDDEEPADAHDDEEPADAHDEEPVGEFEEPTDPLAGPEFVAEDFFQATCAECHGADLGGGDGPDLGPTSHSLGEPDIHLFEAIKFGRKEMPAFIDDLTDEEIEALIAYIRQVQAAG